MNNKAFSFIKQMTRDFQQGYIKIQSHLLKACLLNITKEHQLANDEIVKGEKLLTNEQENISKEKVIEISQSLRKLNRNDFATEILNFSSHNKGEQASVQNNAECIDLKHKAQADIELGLSLYAQKRYSEAINKLQHASAMFPKHTGIKLNLIQTLIVSYEEENLVISYLDNAKVLLMELSQLKLNNEELERLKKMQKKYQQVAGI